MNMKSKALEIDVDGNLFVPDDQPNHSTNSFEVTFSFLMKCRTRGYTINAWSEEQALEKCKQCINTEGEFDLGKFVELGGNVEHAYWDTVSETERGFDITADDIEQEILF